MFGPCLNQDLNKPTENIVLSHLRKFNYGLNFGCYSGIIVNCIRHCNGIVIRKCPYF